MIYLSFTFFTYAFSPLKWIVGIWRSVVARTGRGTRETGAVVCILRPALPQGVLLSQTDYFSRLT